MTSGDYIEELLESTRAYITFVEKEVAPVVESKNGSSETKYLQLRHKDYVSDIDKKAGNLKSAGRKEIEDHFEKGMSDINSAVTMLLAVLIPAALFLAAAQLSSLLKPLIIRHLFLTRLSDEINTAVMVVDKKGLIEGTNKAAGDLLDLWPEAVVNRNLGDIPVLFPHLQSISQPIGNVIAHGQELINHRVTCFNAHRKQEFRQQPVRLLRNPDRAISRGLTDV